MLPNTIATMTVTAPLISVIGCGSKVPSTDGMECVSRPTGGCDTLRTAYTSNDRAALTMNPELASCAQFISFDGCGRLIFSFDQDGCLKSDTSGPDGDNHLGSLRSCFAVALGAKRWPCVAAGTVTFNESCFIP